MNTISGLLLDTKLKEQRKGGERITIFGKISFLEQDITDCWADERVKRGIVLSRERHPVFVESDVERKPEDRRLLITPGGNERENSVHLQNITRASYLYGKEKPLFERRRAADACHRDVAYGKTQADTP
jgi:hypothetical protein